ncbi:MAG: putative transporter [Lentisphaerae bacterium ADurb.Bin242]|nr:MAG: putative transporter [Lentisphaerae bacterium ADurb.Bin242]
MKLREFFQDKANILAVSWLFNQLAYSIVYPFLPLYLHQERGIPMDKVGLIFPLMGLAAIAIPPVSGMLADRIGRRFMLQFGQFSRAGVFLVLAFLTAVDAPFWVFAVTLMVNSGTGVFFQVASDSYLSDISTPESRPGMYSKIRVGFNIAWAIGPMLGAFLARTPFSLIFCVTAGLCLCGGMYSGYFCREPGRKTVAPGLQPPGANYGQLLRNPPFFKLALGSFFLTLLTSQLYSTFSVFATGEAGISRDSLGLLYSLNGILVILFQIPLTKLLDHLYLSQTARLVGGAAFYFAGYLSLAFFGDARLFAFSILVITTGEMIIQPSIYTAVSRLSPDGATGRSMALLSLIRGIGISAGPWFGSVLLQRSHGLPFLLWGGLASFAVIAVIAFAMIRPANRHLINGNP